MSTDIRTDAIVLPEIAEHDAEMRAKIRSAFMAAGITIVTIASSVLAILLHLS